VGAPGTGNAPTNPPRSRRSPRTAPRDRRVDAVVERQPHRRDAHQGARVARGASRGTTGAAWAASRPSFATSGCHSAEGALKTDRDSTAATASPAPTSWRRSVGRPARVRRAARRVAGRGPQRHLYASSWHVASSATSGQDRLARRRHRPDRVVDLGRECGSRSSRTARSAKRRGRHWRDVGEIVGRFPDAPHSRRVVPSPQ